KSLVSIMIPVYDGTTNVIFSDGSLYNSLPISGNKFPYPLSINASFDLNSGRDSIEDSELNNKLVDIAFNRLFKELLLNIRLYKDIEIHKYFIKSSTRLFENKKIIQKVDLVEIIHSIPLLESYSGNKYVSYNKAKILPEQLYGWLEPSVLSECFGDHKKTLVKEKYCPFRLAKEQTKIINLEFVNNLNKYLDLLNVDDDILFFFLLENIYPYIKENKTDLFRTYRAENRAEEIKSLKVFMFEMNDNTFVRESADMDTVWMVNVPESYKSYGKYRNVNNSSIGDVDLSDWINELKNPNEFKKVFSNNDSINKGIVTWKQSKELIETLLYYRVEDYVKVKYLSKCTICKELDSHENIFRIAHENNPNHNILEHVITEDEINSFLKSSLALSNTKLIERLNRFGLRDSNDFFVTRDNILSLNALTKVVLEKYCTSMEKADLVISSIKNTFTERSRKNSDSMLNINFEDLNKVSCFVFSKVFEYKLLPDDRLKPLAT
ncbi:MAG: hypothetical protein Q4B56_07810, partial [Erysipelotrichaceae bacterium]|nr:hypothetical protein [Erysipelotrichaceae bacterium]